MNYTEPYMKACQDAADRQGIAAIVEALAAADITAEVWQTGGFTMAAAVRAASGEVYVVTHDGHYLLGRYKDEEAFCEGTGTYTEVTSLSDVVAALRPVA